MPLPASAELAYDAFEHPEDTAAVIRLVRRALANGTPLRVRGSYHSEQGSVLSDAPRAVHVMIDRLQAFELKEGESPPTVRVGAGVSMGGDPLAPQPKGQAAGNPQADPKRSLFHQLHERGWALPITGGISHQTISGFLATGADGGSIQHSFPRAVQSISFVNGLAELVTSHRDPAKSSAGAPPLPAVLTSLGLFGIVTEVVLELEKTFDVGGLRSVQPVRTGDFLVADRVDGAADARPTLTDFFVQKEYARALWWPEPGVERIELWDAHRLDDLKNPEPEYDPRRNLPDQRSGVPTPLLQVVANALLRLIARLNEDEKDDPGAKSLLGVMESALASKQDMLSALLDSGPLPNDDAAKWGWPELRALLKDLRDRLASGKPREVLRGQPGDTPSIDSEFPNRTLKDRVVTGVINLFVTLSPRALSSFQDEKGFTRNACGALFRDRWHLGLPMDNPVEDRLLPVTFTEVWLPLRHAQAALAALRAEFLAKGLKSTGTFTIELYAAKGSDAWLSPAYETDVLRIDPFWCDNEDELGRQAYFEVFWRVLSDPGFEARLHWGKALPQDYNASTSTRWKGYPMLADFLKLRKGQDPGGLFLTEYWRRHLGIAEPVIAPALAARP
jgi:hypothetical protein